MTPDELVKLLETLRQRIQHPMILLGRGEELRYVSRNQPGGEDPQTLLEMLLAEGFQAIGFIGYWSLPDCDNTIFTICSLPGAEADALIRKHLEAVASLVTELGKRAGRTTQRVDPGWN
jgi:hypothetical protein